MRIGELARAADVSTRALRHYEHQGLLTSHRQANGYRSYDLTAVTRVRNIRLLLDAGLTCDDIRELGTCLDADLDHEPTCGEAIDLFEHRLRTVHDRVRDLVAVRGRLEGELARMRGQHEQHAVRSPASGR